MRRLALSTKLLIAAVPLLLAIGALLTVSTRDNFDEVGQARRGAQLGAIWTPLITSINAIEDEQEVSAGGVPDEIAQARRATDQTMVEMNAALLDIDDSEPLVLQLGQALSAIGLAREGVDFPDLAAARATTAAESYDEAEDDLVALGGLLPAESGDTQLGRELTAVAALAAVEQAGDQLVDEVATNLERPLAERDFDRAQFLGQQLLESVSLFQAVAPEEWQDAFREARFPRALSDGRRTLEELFAYDPTVAGARPVELDLESLSGPVAEIAEFRNQLADDIVTRAEDNVGDLQQSTLVEAGITVGAVALAGLLAWLLTRSITRRVRAIRAKAHEVSDEQLPALVDALRDPRKGGALPDVAPIDDRGTDELAELARSFNAVQTTLVDVAHEQIEVLRRGVSDIFVTMARRNRSLVDRQLALLDELEAEVDDPDVLANYYRLDHLATRMRRNSESLLVLANAEPKRRRTKATEIDDVVRAAVGEVEDYRRIDVQHLDSLQVRGNVVADVSHLLAELLDNAASFSPPESRVRVSGRFAGDHYLITIADDGVGVNPERMAELNALLAEPPIVGLSVEPTLGISVVSLLAHKHGVKVSMLASSPGVTVEVLLPSALYGPIDAVQPADTDVLPAVPAASVDADPIVSWSEDTIRLEEAFASPAYAEDEPVAPAVAADAGGPAPLRIDPLLVAGASRLIEQHDAVDADAADRPDDHDTVDTVTTADTVDRIDTVAEVASGVVAPEPASASLPGEPLRIDLAAHLEAAASNGNGTHAHHADEPIAPAAAGAPAAEADPLADLATIDLTPAWRRGDGGASEPEPVVEIVPLTATDDEPAEQQLDPAAFEPEPVAGYLPAAAPPLPPPPPGGPVAGEFDVPPAPPPFGTGPTPGPMIDRPLPTRRPEPVAASANGRGGPAMNPAGLPVRPRAGALDTGPDRLADQPVVAGPPSSLQSALSAFDAGRNGAAAPSLPTRSPGNAFDHEDVTPSTTASRLDPDAIRERLRAFQQEYRIGRTADDPPANGDHGGDR